MNNPFGITDKSYLVILDALKQCAEIEKATIFGSRAKRNYKAGSDIDIAIAGRHCTMQTAVSLENYLNEEAPVPFHVDVVCYNQLKHAELKDHIDKVGKDFYKPTRP